MDSDFWVKAQCIYRGGGGGGPFGVAKAVVSVELDCGGLDLLPNHLFGIFPNFFSFFNHNHNNNNHLIIFLPFNPTLTFPFHMKVEKVLTTFPYLWYKK